MEREPNTIYTLSLSYGKDSLACLGAIEELGLPLDRIVHAEVLEVFRSASNTANEFI